MCGIAGYAGSQEAMIDLNATCEVLAHRGPDGSGVRSFSQAGLAHTRLAIIDTSSAAAQPMSTDDDRYWLSYNGEIYNFTELRERFRGRERRRYRGHGDTEVVLNALADHGHRALPLLNGMFSIALWDDEAEELLLARDRFGIKPLYYAVDGGSISFASEIRALRTARIHDEHDPQALAEYLVFGSPLGPRTMHKDVRSLEPGSYLKWRGGEVQIRAYHDWAPPSEGYNDRSLGAHAREIRELLGRSVERQLVADRSVGVLLSGGIDSGLIAALAGRSSRSEITAYTINFGDVRFHDETVRAGMTAAEAGIDHEIVNVEAAPSLELLGELQSAHGEPFGDPADIPIFLMTRALDGHAPVLLQGDGGDEFFGGYRRHGLLRWNRIAIPLSTWLVSGAERRRQVLEQVPQRLRRLITAFGEANSGRRMGSLLTTVLDHEPYRFLSPCVRAEVERCNVFARYETFADHFRDLDPLESMLLTDVNVVLPDIFLQKVDRASMSNSVEVRVPLLDNDVADYALSIPPQDRVRFGRKKAVLRKAAEPLLPKSVARGPKRGFGVPYTSWLVDGMEDVIQQILGGVGNRESGLLNAEALPRWLSPTSLSRMSEQERVLAWRYLQLALWCSNERA